MRLTIEVSEGPADLSVGQADTAQPRSPGDAAGPTSIPAGALDAGADSTPRPPEPTATPAPPRAGQFRTAGLGIPGAPAEAIPVPGPSMTAGQVLAAGPEPDAHVMEPQGYSPGIAVDIVPGAGPVIS